MSEIGIPLGRQLHLLGHKGLKPLKAALEGGVVKGGMGIRRHIPHRAAFLEQLVGAGGMGQAIINDLALMAQALNSLHGGQSLELSPVVMGKMECDESGAHRLTPRFHAFRLFSIPQAETIVYAQNEKPPICIDTPPLLSQKFTRCLFCLWYCGGKDGMICYRLSWSGIPPYVRIALHLTTGRKEGIHL